jgi:hypothetical protein
LADEQPVVDETNAPSETTDTSAVADSFQSGIDAQANPPEPSELNPELIAEAKASYGWTDDNLSTFKSDDALTSAMLDFDNQLLNPQPQQGLSQPRDYPVPMPQSPPPQQEFQAQQQEPVGVPPNLSHEFPELDKEMMDDTQYQALTALHSKYQEMNTMVQDMHHHIQQSQTDQYLARYTPSVSALNDGRFTEHNPNYDNNLYQLLSTVENLNQGRVSRGMQPMSDSDAISAAYRTFVHYNGSGTGVGDQFIGQPAASRQSLAPGESKALRQIENSEFYQNQTHNNAGYDRDEDLLAGFDD